MSPVKQGKECVCEGSLHAYGAKKKTPGKDEACYVNTKIQMRLRRKADNLRLGPQSS